MERGRTYETCRKNPEIVINSLTKMTSEKVLRKFGKDFHDFKLNVTSTTVNFDNPKKISMQTKKFRNVDK